MRVCERKSGRERMLLGEEGAYSAYRVAIGLKNRARGVPLFIS